MSRIKDLGYCIELINSAETAEEAFEHYCRIMEECGYNRIAYSLVTDHPSLELPSQHGLATSYPEDWMKFYVENNYMEVDPVVDAVLNTRKPFFWQDLIDDPDIKDDSLLLMRQAEESGIHAGISFSLQGLSGETVGIGLARDCMDNDKRDYEFMAQAYLLSTYFHETFREMILKPQLPKLTLKESDLLHWAAEGKSDPEIAMIMDITIHTVRFHWKNIFIKLQANGRIYAVTKAIRLGMIAPKIIKTS